MIRGEVVWKMLANAIDQRGADSYSRGVMHNGVIIRLGKARGGGVGFEPSFARIMSQSLRGSLQAASFIRVPLISTLLQGSGESSLVQTTKSTISEASSFEDEK